MFNKQFSDRLNQELDKMELPKPLEERIDAFSKLIHVPRFKAEIILNGHIPTEEETLNKIIDELEVSREWLLGKEGQ
jgi:hypothetical protein